MSKIVVAFLSTARSAGRGLTGGNAMDFVRSLDQEKSFDTGFPGYTVQILAQQESSLFLASTIQEGGRGPELHYHESDQIYFLLRGNMTVRLVDEVHRITPGTLVHIPAGLPHCNWNEGPGPETHLEAIIPMPSFGQDVAHIIDTPSDVPPEHRTTQPGTVTSIDPDQLAEPLPGFRMAPLVDPGMGVDRMTINYAEVEPGNSGPGVHVHRFDQFYFILEGEFTVDVGLDHHVIGPDNLVRLPAGVPHSNKNAADVTEKHLAILTPSPTEDAPWDYGVDFSLNGNDHRGKFTRPSET